MGLMKPKKLKKYLIQQYLIQFVIAIIFFVSFFTILFSGDDLSSVDVILYLFGIVVSSIFIFDSFKHFKKIEKITAEDVYKNFKDHQTGLFEIEEDTERYITQVVEWCGGCLWSLIKIIVALIFIFIIGVVVIAIIKWAFMIVF